MKVLFISIALLTSTMPVYSADSSNRVLSSNSYHLYSCVISKGVIIADTDLQIRRLKKLLSANELSVDGYVKGVEKSKKVLKNLID